MKNCKKFSLCTLAILCLTSTIFLAKEQEKDDGYWTKMVARVSALFASKKDLKSEDKKEKSGKKQKSVAPKPQAPEMSRDQALEEIKKVTTVLFDPQDANHISLHLNKMKDFIKFLDDVQDKKLIAAIHFLLDNQHRSGTTDLLFWLKANSTHQFDIIIPMTPEVAAKTKAEKLMVLKQKMTVKK